MKINPQIQNYISNKNSIENKNAPQESSEKNINQNEDKVTLSQEGLLKSKQMDNQQKISELKKSIENNTYNIDSNKVANSIIEIEKLLN